MTEETERPPEARVVEMRKSVDSSMMQMALDQPLDREPGATAPELPQGVVEQPTSPGVDIRESVDTTSMELTLDEPLSREAREAPSEPSQGAEAEPPQPTDSK